MSGYTVTIPFNTPTRRFAVGQPVTEADLDGSLTLEDRVRLGQIAAPAPQPVVILDELHEHAAPDAGPELKPTKSGKGKAATEPDPTA